MSPLSCFSQSFCHTHTCAHTQPKHPKVSLPLLISRETQTKQPVTYPLQPREMLVNINVPIHAGYPCQQFESLVEKKPSFLAGAQALSSSLPLPPPPQEQQAVFQFSHFPGLCPVAFLSLNRLRYTRLRLDGTAPGSSPTAPTGRQAGRQAHRHMDTHTDQDRLHSFRAIKPHQKGEAEVVNTYTLERMHSLTHGQWEPSQ